MEIKIGIGEKIMCNVRRHKRTALSHVSQKGVENVSPVKSTRHSDLENRNNCQ